MSGTMTVVQLNKYEKDPYFLHFFQSNTTVFLVIHVFCKSCEPELEIVFGLICPLAEQFHVHRSYKTRESTMSYIGNFEESHIHLAVYLAIFYLFYINLLGKSRLVVEWEYGVAGLSKKLGSFHL